MPRRLAAKPKQPAVSRTTLDAKLAEAYDVSSRTIRLWRRKDAPLNDPAEMPDWIADQRRQGKGDGADVRAARLRKLALQIEALETAERNQAGQFVSRERWHGLVAPMFGELRLALRDLLLSVQPPLIAGKSESDVRALTTEQFRSFVARIHAWTKAHSVVWQAEARQAPANLPSLVHDEPADAPKVKPGRVADPEMEALRVRKLTLECQALERENRAATGDLLPVDATLRQADEQIGSFRQEVKQLLTTEQPTLLPGRQEDAILDLNRKALKSLYRRLHDMAEKLFGQHHSPRTNPEDTNP